MVSAQTEETLEAEKYLRDLIAWNKRENIIDAKQIRNKQSSTFKSVPRSERFEEKNRIKGSISPDVGRYHPSYEVIHKKQPGALDYEKFRNNEYEFDIKFNYLDSRLGCDKQWESGLNHNCKKTDCYHKWISKKKGCI